MNQLKVCDSWVKFIMHHLATDKIDIKPKFPLNVIRTIDAQPQASNRETRVYHRLYKTMVLS